jgi:hypothetical protein
MMNVQQTPALQQNADLSALVAQRNDVLDAAIGQHVAGASATWDLTADSRNRPVLVLRLRDTPKGQAEGRFAPDELRNIPHLSARLGDLKAALIRVGGWLGQLERLYADIRQWSQALPAAYVEELPLTVREERSGPYEATMLRVSSNARTMTVEPVAAWVVGADGRVDLKGVGGPFTLVYSQPKGGWYHVENKPPLTFLPLDQALYLDLARACLDE